jgi:hypothetical protein
MPRRSRARDLHEAIDRVDLSVEEAALRGGIEQGLEDSTGDLEVLSRKLAGRGPSAESSSRVTRIGDAGEVKRLIDRCDSPRRRFVSAPRHVVSWAAVAATATGWRFVHPTVHQFRNVPWIRNADSRSMGLRHRRVYLFHGLREPHELLVQPAFARERHDRKPGCVARDAER